MGSKDKNKQTGYLEALLWPIVAFCLRRSIAYPDLLDCLKKLYIRAARQELAKASLPESASRIAAMTGVHRKDIARLSSHSSEATPVSSPFARVMVQWKYDKRFYARKGQPRPLSAEGRSSEFAALVDSVLGGDINGYAILAELERRGVVKKENGMAHLLWQDFAPEPEEEKSILMLARDVGSLVAAVEENIFERSTVPNMHLTTQYDNIVIESLPELRQQLLREGSEFHEKVNLLVSKYDVDLNPALKGKPSGAHLVVGTFSMTSTIEKPK